MTPENKSLDQKLEQLVLDVYAKTSPFTHQRWVVDFALQAAAYELEISEISMVSLTEIRKLRKAHAFLDGHNWSDWALLLNEGVMDVCQYLLARKSEMVVR